MSIPDYQDCMLPILELISDGREHRMNDLTRRIADRFELSEPDRTEVLPSGSQTVIANRVGWAKTYLKKAGLLANPVRGIVKITAAGTEVLAKRPSRIGNELLQQYPSFNEFLNREAVANSSSSAPDQSSTPEESIDTGYRELNAALADELLEKVRNCSPRFFEQLVVDLLVAMGYGGSLKDAGQAIGKSGDGGIDGMIKEDKLGLDVVCVQAKRWNQTVGRPEVQAFAGSMEGVRAKKGVLITTSSFSKEAQDYIQRIERKIVLLDGKTLTNLMIEHGVGVEMVRTYVIRKINFDYFENDIG
ncbi:restriction endonuclease [Schlesneria paludicola]|uniref:restriction endonuclease n=1 Tax=Schlesneria paludicola TaxID=360056 RepID=UPI00029B1B13|nr:restriction endonuclease [Schlesneria paludicola]